MCPSDQANPAFRDWADDYVKAELGPKRHAPAAPPRAPETFARFVDSLPPYRPPERGTARPGASGPAPWDIRPSDPLARYFTPWAPAETPSAVETYLAEHHARIDENPLGGLTDGEKAALWQIHVDREKAEARKTGSGVDTELRDVLSSIKGLESFSGRAAMLRGVQRIHKLRGHRVGVCLRYMSKRGPERDGQRVVEVVGGAEKSPRYKGIVVCGNGWVCPVCAAKITEKRREELRAGVQRHRNAGGAVVLTTFTFPHGANDALRPAWEKLGKALQIFARDRDVKAFRKAMGFLGRVRSREITYGINGWHPHSHALELLDGAACHEESLDEWQTKMKRAWQRACLRADLDEPSYEHGFTMNLTDVDDYIAKWGVDAELTKWHIKRGKVDPDAPGETSLNGLTPFDLLRVHVGELRAHERLKLDSDRAAALFTEYAKAVKGTAQLHWSRNLKKTLDIESVTDAEAAIADRDDEETLGTLTASDWYAIVHRNRQVEFLGLVKAFGFEGASLFLQQWREELDAETDEANARSFRRASFRPP